MIDRKWMLVLSVAGCGKADLFSLEGFDNAVPIEQAAKASFKVDDHDVSRVKVLGDLDGDGHPDLVFTDYSWEPEGHLQSNYYVVYGDPSFTGEIDLATMPQLVFDPGVTVPHDLDALEPLGDIDGDGLADLAISKQYSSAYGHGCDGIVQTGVYVVYGSSTRITGKTRLADIGVTVQEPTTCQGSRAQPAALGDLDGDGLADFGIIDALAANSDSQLYVFYGRHDRLAAAVDLTSADAVLMQAAPDQAEMTVPLGDVDGDGLDDVLVSTVDNTAFTYAGRILYGSSARLAGSSAIDAPRNTLIPTVDCVPRFTSVSALHDLDGDGLADFAITQCRPGDIFEPDLDPTQPLGNHFVFYGRTGGFGASFDLTAADATIPTAQGDQVSLLLSGDTDGDGVLDLVLTEPMRQHGDGAVFVIPGTGRRLSGFMDEAAFGAAYVGHEIEIPWWTGELRLVGTGVGSFGVVNDLDGDGRADVLVGPRAWSLATDAQVPNSHAYLISPSP